MQDMFENAKRMANTAVERAAWEADKLRRSSARQREVEFAQRERTTLLEQLAGMVADLDQRGQITQEPLKMLAQRLRALDTEIARGHGDVQAIRAETFTPGSISISVTHQGTGSSTPCPTCGQPVRSGAAYCSACGTRLR